MATITIPTELIRTAEAKAQEEHELAVAAIKAECRRRILLIMTEDQQRNTLAAGQEASMTYGPNPAEWPPEFQARQADAMTAWAEIKRLRERSNEIELMDPLPAGDDLVANALWAEVD